MSTTFSMPDSYTVFGQSIQPSHGISCVLLNRAGRYELAYVIQNLNNCGFTTINCIEVEGDSYKSAQLCQQFDGLRVFLFHSRKNWGELVNLVINESNSEYVMVLWSDMESRLPARKIMEYAKAYNDFCIVPQLVGVHGDVLPAVHTPELQKGDLTIMSSPPLYQHTRTLYPTDFTGVYQRELFLYSGGFDPDIVQPYWQLVDLGFRSGLYSKRITVDSRWKVSYRSMNNVRSRNEAIDYARFYLKNITLDFSSSTVRIPIISLFRLWIKKHIPLLTLFRLRASIQRWAKHNNHKFSFDAKRLLQFWQETNQERTEEYN